MLLNIQQVIDDAKCYAVVRDLRWRQGVRCARVVQQRSPEVAFTINKRIRNARMGRGWSMPC